MATINNIPEITFRSSAFWRIVDTVYMLTKSNPDLFLGSEIQDEIWDKEEDKLLVTMIYKYSKKTANIGAFPTKDKNILAKAVLKVVEVFAKSPEVRKKILTMFGMTMAGMMMMTERGLNENAEHSESVYMRSTEIRDLSKLMFEVANEISHILVVPKVDLEVREDGNEYLTFSVISVQ
jgi:hypothetical protein